jgi:hypothetical protein
MMRPQNHSKKLKTCLNLKNCNMPWDKLQNLLKTSVLEKETKLSIINAIALAPNKELVNEIIDLLSDWKETDDQAHVVFKDQLAELVEKYDKKLEEISEEALSDDVKIADEVQTQENIAKIKDQINKI